MIRMRKIFRLSSVCCRITCHLVIIVSILCGCTFQRWDSLHNRSHPLVGKIWSVEKNEAIQLSELVQALKEARFVLLGEKHDNPDHHRIRAELIREILQSEPVVAVLEHIDKVYDQQDLKGVSIDEFPDAIEWNKSGWPDWSIYRPLFEELINPRVSIVPGGLKLRGGLNEHAGLIKQYQLDQAHPPVLASKRRNELRTSHCNLMPENSIDKLLVFQQLRDVIMAQSLVYAEGESKRLLLAGNGHVRTDWGVPYFIKTLKSEEQIVSVGFIEVISDAVVPDEYAEYLFAERLPFDYIYFTPVIDPEDPCKRYKHLFTRGKDGA